MKRIGLVIRPGVEEARDLALKISNKYLADGHSVCVDERSAGILSELWNGDVLNRDELVERCDPIVTLGGDGTLIGVARHVSHSNPVMIGVNFGTLGFLTEISPDEVFPAIDAILSGEGEVGHRAMIQCEVLQAGRVVSSGVAINDAVIQKGSRDKLLDLDLQVNGQEVMRLRADGMIVSTPTGSTAYSLAAGGSIVHPRIEAVLVTPICAHSLTNRPFIVPLDFELEVSIPAYDGEVFVSLDGQESFDLSPGQLVRVKKSPHQVCFARSDSMSYFNILQSKLNWGIPNKGD